MADHVATAASPHAGRRLMARAVGFGRALRLAGLDSDAAAAATFAQALTRLDLAQRADVKAAGAAVFVRRREQLSVYGQVFDEWWTAAGGREPPPRRLGTHATQPSEMVAAGSDARAGVKAPDERALMGRGRWSPLEVVRRREFEHMSEAELREAERAIDRLAPRLARRRSRRYRVDAHGNRLAPRQMLRHNVPAGGDLIAWRWRRRLERPRDVVVLADVSGSMARHVRLLLRFARALSVTNGLHTEAFVFGTRLTRVTRLLRANDPDIALARVAQHAADWGGGTRMGAAFRDFNRQWGRRTLRSSGVVVVVSDGWDRGDARQVARETARLRRACHRLIWVNPVAGVPGYEPTAAGMAAAYPYVDRLVPARSMASLEHLAQLLAGALS